MTKMKLVLKLPYFYYPDPPVPEAPVLLFLHGVGEGFVSRKQVGHLNLLQQGPPKHLDSLREDHPLRTSFTFVAPQLPERDTLWNEAVGDVEEIVDRYRSHGEKLYIMGFSKGGLGAFQLAKPLEARAIVAIDASPMRMTPQKAFDQCVATMGQRPFWAVYTNSLQHVQEFNELLTKSGHEGLSIPPKTGARTRSFVRAPEEKGSPTLRHTWICDEVSVNVAPYKWLLQH